MNILDTFPNGEILDNSDNLDKVNKYKINTPIYRLLMGMLRVTRTAP